MKYNTFKVFNGSIIKDSVIIENAAILIDKDLEFPTVHKIGDVSIVGAAYDNMIMKYREANLNEMADNLMLITFQGNLLSKDEICVIMNYALRCSGSVIIKYLISGDMEKLKGQIKNLREMGY